MSTMLLKKRKRKKKQAEVAPPPSPHETAPSPADQEPNRPPAVPPDLTPGAPSAAPGTPILEEEAAAAARKRRKERKRKKEDVAAAPSPPPEEEEPATAAATRRGKKRSKRREQEERIAPSAAAATGTPSLEAEAAPARRKRNPPTSSQPPPPASDDQTTRCVQSQGSPAPPGEEQEEAGRPNGKRVKSSSSSKKPRVMSTRELIKMRIELRKQQPQPLPEGLAGAMAAASNPNIQQDPKHSSPFGAFFDQFAYKPSRQDRNQQLPTTPERLARPPPRGHPSSGSSQLIANETPKINISKTSKTPKINISKASKTVNSKRKPKVLDSASCSQEKGELKENEKPEKKQRKPPPLLTNAEKRSDKYRRLPLDQLVPPPRSPHKLLQEKYASDPWKVVVICMLLNLTQGTQVRKKVKGFFRRYPDAQTAINADPEKMARYLAPLGLQRVKANRIQKFSKMYVEDEWTHITQLCGVGKYAADAYAIFCAGKATEVVPQDHKLVDYWKYVCFELPMIQKSQKMQEAGVTEVETVIPKLQELTVCC